MPVLSLRLSLRALMNVGLLQLVVGSFVLGLPALAQAQSPEPVAVPSPDPASPDQASADSASTDRPSTDKPNNTDQWLQTYTWAREQLVVGKFAEASAAFFHLATTTSDPTRRTLAGEMARLSQRWATDGLVLLPRADSRAGSMSAMAIGEDKRSLDELAMLYTNAVFYGIGSGFVLALNTKPDTAAGVVLPTLALTGAAVGAVAYMDSGDSKLRYGIPQSIISGLYLGLEQGLVWMLWNQARVGYEDEWEEETVGNVLWVASTVGAVAGGIVGSAAATTPGRASLMGSGGLWTSLVSGLVVGGFDGAFEDDDSVDEHALLAAAIGLNVGAAAGAWFATETSPSIARVRFVDLGGISGGLVAGGLYLALADDDSDPYAGMLVTGAGISAGLVATWIMTRTMDEDLPRSNASKSITSSWAPSIAPTSEGGVMMGLAGTL